MKFVFIDDSIQRRPPRAVLGELIALGAIIVPEKQITGFASDLAEIKNRLGIPQDEEVKWNSAKGSFLAQAGGATATELRMGILEAAIRRGITSVVHVLDHSLVYKDRAVAARTARSALLGIRRGYVCERQHW